MSTPNHTHDCDRCKFLGSDDSGRDWYYCQSVWGPDEGTIIMRRSSDPPDYCSSRISGLWRKGFDPATGRQYKAPPKDPLSWAFQAFHMWKEYIVKEDQAFHIWKEYIVKEEEKDGD